MREILWIWIMNDEKKSNIKIYPGGFCFPFLDENIKLREKCLLASLFCPLHPSLDM